MSEMLTVREIIEKAHDAASSAAMCPPISQDQRRYLEIYNEVYAGVFKTLLLGAPMDIPGWVVKLGSYFTDDSVIDRVAEIGGAQDPLNEREFVSLQIDFARPTSSPVSIVKEDSDDEGKPTQQVLPLV